MYYKRIKNRSKITYIIISWNHAKAVHNVL